MKKFAAVSTAVIMGLGALLAGCSSDAQPPASSSAPQASANKPAEKPIITVSVYDEGTQSGPISPSEGTMDKNRWVDWINANSPVNVKFVVIPRQEEKQKLNVMFASGTAPDLIITPVAANRDEWYSQKLLMPLDELIEKHSTVYKELMKKDPVIKKMGLKSDGKMYELPFKPGPKPTETMFVRVDWLKKLNLSMPKTTEDLFNVAKAFSKNDPDGNGKDDTFGMMISGPSSANTLSKMFQYDEWFHKDGQILKSWDQMQAMTEFKKRLFDEGIISKDYLTDKTGQKGQQDWINGKVGFAFFSNGAQDLKLYDSFKKNNPSGEIMIMELPRSQFGQFSASFNPGYNSGAVVNAQTKNPEAVMKYIDFLLTQEANLTLSYGVEGTHYKLVNGCPQIIDQEKFSKEVSYTFWYKWFRPELFNGACDFEKTVDLNDPIQKDVAGFYVQAKNAYFAKERPGSKTFLIEPKLSADLKLIVTNTTKPIEDLMDKAVVSGKGYTVEQAMKDAKAVWEKAGGAKVDEFYKNSMKNDPMVTLFSEAYPIQK